jgi:hypothetical protein
MPAVSIEEKAESPKGLVSKLFVKKQSAVVKIEPNQVIRGSLFGPEERDLCKRAEEVFEKFVTTKTLAFSELYGSKICAALDIHGIFSTLCCFLRMKASLNKYANRSLFIL